MLLHRFRVNNVIDYINLNFLLKFPSHAGGISIIRIFISFINFLYLKQNRDIHTVVVSFKFRASQIVMKNINYKVYISGKLCMY